MASKLRTSKKALCADPMVLLKELKAIAPDVLEKNKRCLIPSSRFGNSYQPEYIEYLQKVIRKLSEYKEMLYAEHISEVEYERKKMELLFNLGVKAIHSQYPYPGQFYLQPCQTTKGVIY